MLNLFKDFVGGIGILLFAGLIILQFAGMVKLYQLYSIDHAWTWAGVIFAVVVLSFCGYFEYFS